MMIIPFKGSHISEMVEFGAQEWMRPFVVEGDLQVYENGGTCVSAAVDGKIIGSAGLIHMNDFRAIAWAILSTSSRRHMFEITLGIHDFFRKKATHKRIEAYVDVGFEQGIRWAEMLKFKREGGEKEYWLNDGRSVFEYVRIREG